MTRFTDARMTCLLLSGLGLSACMSPSPLEAENPPSIVSGDPDFLAGPVVWEQADAWSLGVVAQDLAIEPSLTARLYFLVGQQYQPLGSTTLAAFDPSDPTLQRGHLEVGELCPLLPLPYEGLVYVVVGDRSIPEDTPPPDLPRAHFDYRHWAIRCQ